ncbi:hypothetical protein RYX36_005861 [Vicia faba]
MNLYSWRPGSKVTYLSLSVLITTFKKENVKRPLEGEPLYGYNYGSVLEAIDKMEKDLSGFFYAGNHRGGLSVGRVIASGCKAADLVIAYLNNASDNTV